jgi:hypothetical protein
MLLPSAVLLFGCQLLLPRVPGQWLVQDNKSTTVSAKLQTAQSMLSTPWVMVSKGSG